ncbi:MAG: hypothetical protein LBF09_00880 [Odoribacteraceae bacterium]|jgi:hypothetical protein|nr:hypothetical protein [Odoribacteraceae bacterium]
MKHENVYRYGEGLPFKGQARFTPAIEIDELNWPMQYPSRPFARVKIGYDAARLFLSFDVKEDLFRANVQEDNGRVWEDSCVEFFFQPGGDGGYYNLECNAIGTLLLAHGHDRHGREQAPPWALAAITRQAPVQVRRQEGKALYCWSLALAIPFTSFFRHRLSPRPGDTARANFYKCGDKLPVPHFLSWNPVRSASPDFHRPVDFGILSFQP